MTFEAVTAVNSLFFDMVKICVASTGRCWYEHTVYNLDDSARFKEIFGVFPPIDEKEIRLWKPKYMLQARNTSDADLVFWIDADSVVHQPFGDIGDDFDIGVVALSHKLKLCASPVFIRETGAAQDFMSAYIHAAREGRGDMYALRGIFNKYHELTPDSLNNVVDVGGVKVKVFDSVEYAYKVRTTDDLDVPGTVKCIHFSGDGPTREIKRPKKLGLMEAYVHSISL